MPKGIGYPGGKKGKGKKKPKNLPKKKKSALQEIKDRAKKNRDALNFE